MENETPSEEANNSILSAVKWGWSQLSRGLWEIGQAAIYLVQMKFGSTVARKPEASTNRTVRMSVAATVAVLALIGILALKSARAARIERIEVGRREEALREQAELERARIEAAKVWICADCRMPIMKSEGVHASSEATKSVCISCFQRRENARKIAEEAKIQEARLTANRKAVEDAKRAAEVARESAERERQQEEIERKARDESERQFTYFKFVDLVTGQFSTQTYDTIQRQFGAGTQAESEGIGETRTTWYRWKTTSGAEIRLCFVGSRKRLQSKLQFGLKPSADDYPSQTITYDSFQSARVGTKLHDIRNRWGVGVETSRAGSGDNRLTMYRWSNPDGSFVVGSFEGRDGEERLTAISQSGLK